MNYRRSFNLHYPFNYATPKYELPLYNTHLIQDGSPTNEERNSRGKNYRFVKVFRRPCIIHNIFWTKTTTTVIPPKIDRIVIHIIVLALCPPTPPPPPPVQKPNSVIGDVGWWYWWWPNTILSLVPLQQPSTVHVPRYHL